MLTLQQIRWCAYLARKSNCGPVEAAKNCAALAFAHNDMHMLTKDNIRVLASLINPDVKTWREINLSGTGSDHTEIDAHIDQLVEAWNAGRLDAKNLFWEYSAIHPFGVNVNYQVGCILYVWCARMSGVPHFPPAYMMNEGDVK